uniref:Uncharacterized protein n=1 Tax=Panagrolaimus superbus TaxID=310955 RepID=A0A914YI02_9BILA
MNICCTIGWTILSKTHSISGLTLITMVIAGFVANVTVKSYNTPITFVTELVFCLLGYYFWDVERFFLQLGQRLHQLVHVEAICVCLSLFLVFLCLCAVNYGREVFEQMVV